MTLPAPHRMAYAPCPRCRHTLTGAGSLSQPEPPKHGDLTVCLRCAAVLQFDQSPIGTLGLRLMSAADLSNLEEEERRELEQVERAVLATLNGKGGKA